MPSGKGDEELKHPEPIHDLREEAGWQQLKQSIQEFCSEARASAERPEAFWERQRLSVHARLGHHPPASAPHRRAWIWASATAMVALGLILLIERREIPRPDFAAGHDEQLLLDVERALNRDLPSPLEPAALLPEEMFPRGRILAEP